MKNLEELDDSLFTPAKTGRVGEHITLQIEAAIASGKIQPGEGIYSTPLDAQFLV